MIYTSYEFDNGIKANYDLIQIQKDKSLPFFINSIHFIQKCYHYYANDDRINMLIHNVYDMANNQKKYYHFKTIIKRNGKDRLLSIPNDELMYVLKYINHNVLSWYKPLPCVYAYVKHKGIKENAEEHLHSKYILKLDIKDFFGSIKFGKVVNNILPKDSYEEELRILLANLCMVNGSIPQGAPTSPTLSNIIMHKFDEIIMEYCKDNNLIYTRYADDMIISSVDIFDVKKVISKVKYLLKKYYHMELNDDKTIILHNGMKQEICGVIVNEKLNVSKKYRDSIRQEVYYLKKYGAERHIQALFYDNKLEDVITPMEYYQKLLGKINFILSINKDNEEFIKYKELILSYIEELKPKKIKQEKKIRYPEELTDYLLNKHKHIVCEDYCDFTDVLINVYCNKIPISKKFIDYIFENKLLKEKSIKLLFMVSSRQESLDYLLELIEDRFVWCLDLAENNEKSAVYFMMIHYLNNNNFDAFKYWAYRLKSLGNYRGIYLLSQYENGKKFVKEAADNHIAIAQYNYALTLNEGSKKYYEYMLSAAENEYEDAMIKAVEIYESFELYEEAYRFICKLALREIDEYMELAVEYREKYKYDLPEKLEEILSQWGFL